MGAQGSSVSVTVNHDEIFQKDLEIQRLQIKVRQSLPVCLCSLDHFLFLARLI